MHGLPEDAEDLREDRSLSVGQLDEKRIELGSRLGAHDVRANRHAI